MSLTFSTVIATRNRSDVLAVSLPLHLQQSRLPERIVVVDSSDDMSANRALVACLNEEGPVPVTHIASAAGSSLQRNIGMDQVDSDVIFFPDDDSILYPDTLHHMMRIYEKDADQRIGGVTTSTATSPPDGVLRGKAVTVAKMKDPGWLRLRAHDIRHALERWPFPEPMEMASHRLYRGIPAAEPWLESENSKYVKWMLGYCMSFREAAIRRVRFNVALGRYSFAEDVDACFQVLRVGQAIAVAHNSKIYHHKSPENRMASYEYGAARILNNAYVVLRSGVGDRTLRNAIRRHSWFKTRFISLDRKGAYGSEQHRGARAACKVLPELLTSRPENLDETYLALRKRCGITDD